MHLRRLKSATGGGLSPDGQRWIAGRENYFLPVRVLGQLFRGKFLARLNAAYQAGVLTLAGSVESLRDPANFRRLRGALYRKRWIVYAKPPFGGASQVYRYLGRYTHRVAISNRRLVSMEQDRVTFQYKDYADQHRHKQMTLDAEEFIRRFLLHVLPKGFVRIRHYGLLAGRNVDTKLADCRRLLSGHSESTEVEHEPKPEDRQASEEECLRCPNCQAPLRRFELPPAYLGRDFTSASLTLVTGLDSS